MLRGEMTKNMDGCPVSKAMQLLGGKWRLVIIGFLQERTMRFKELEREIGIISPKMLTATLDEMEQDGLVTRTVTMQKPLKVEYALTELGRKSKPIIDELIRYGLMVNGVELPAGEIVRPKGLDI